MTGGGGTISNITQIAARNHYDLNNLNFSDDHLGYLSVAPSHDVITSWTVGLDAAKTATPSVGAVYLASDTKKVYYCSTINVWSFRKNITIDSNVALNSIMAFDGNNPVSIPPVTGGFVLTDNGVGNLPTFQSLSSQVGSKSGVTSKLMTDASVAQTIAHGLGRVPRIVRFRGFNSTSASVISDFSGVYDGTNNNYVNYGNSNGTSAVIFTNTAAALGLGENNQNPTLTGQTGVVTVDATNITITWTKHATTIATTAQILWEAS